MNIGSIGTYTMIKSMLKDSFQKGIEETTINAKELYEEIPSSAKINVYSFMAHIGGLRTWAYGEPRVRRNVETHDFSKTNLRFEDTFSIPIDDIEDDQLNQYGMIAKSLGIKAMQKIEEQLFNVFNNGFTTETTWDALSYFNDSHTVGISTINNARTAALSTTSFEEAYEAITGFTFQPDSASPTQPLNPNGKYVLLVPPQLTLTAKAIAENPLVPTGGTNTYASLGVKVIGSSWLTSPTAWFLVNVGDSMKPVIWQKRQNPEFKTLTPSNGGDEFTYDEITYGVKLRGIAFASNPWLAIGSTGAGS